MKYLSLAIVAIASISVLQGCDTTEVALPQFDSYQAQESCKKLMENSPEYEIGFVDEQFNEDDETGWYTSEEINEGMNIFTGLREWRNSDVIALAVDKTSPSGDWVRYDSYCVDKSGLIANLDSELNTFYGNVKVLRDWTYDPNGEMIETNISIFDIGTDENIDPNGASYMDNPPYFASSYNDLVDYLELLTQVPVDIQDTQSVNIDCLTLRSGLVEIQIFKPDELEKDFHFNPIIPERIGRIKLIKSKNSENEENYSVLMIGTGYYQNIDDFIKFSLTDENLTYKKVDFNGYEAAYIRFESEEEGVWEHYRVPFADRLVEIDYHPSVLTYDEVVQVKGVLDNIIFTEADENINRSTLTYCKNTDTLAEATKK